MARERLTEKDACPRCGYERVVRLKGLLCVDCKEVLTPEERAVWNPRYQKRGARTPQRELAGALPSAPASLVSLETGWS